MTVTKILGAQSGIQYQGVKEKSETDPSNNAVNALFTGQFKRGPFNKPFKVTRENIRGKLGFDSNNLMYQTLEDCLKQGAPFVWVMRVKSQEDEGLDGDENMGWDTIFTIDSAVNGVCDLTVSPLSGEDFNMMVDWGDGSELKNYTSADSKVHYYDDVGIYKVKIKVGPVDYFRYSPNTIEIFKWDTIQVNHLAIQSTLIEKVPTTLNTSATMLANMFYKAYVFNQDISGWDVSKILNMQGMFQEAYSFNQDISGWNTGNVISMSSMFLGAQNFNTPIGSWDVRNVENVDTMFLNVSPYYDAPSWATGISKFNQNLSNWCVAKIPVGPQWFASAISPEYKPVWGTCPGLQPELPSGPIKIQNLTKSLYSSVTENNQPVGLHIKMINESGTFEEDFIIGFVGVSDQFGFFFGQIIEKYFGSTFNSEIISDTYGGIGFLQRYSDEASYLVSQGGFDNKHFELTISPCTDSNAIDMYPHIFNFESYPAIKFTVPGRQKFTQNF